MNESISADDSHLRMQEGELTIPDVEAMANLLAVDPCKWFPRRSEVA
jgi:hypothetical protein